MMLLIPIIMASHTRFLTVPNRSLRKLKTYLGRVIRDIGRRIDGDAELEDIFAQPLSLSRRVLAQDQRQRGPKVYSLHAPEVECIGKGKAHRPYEFGVKVSVATTVHRSKGGQFVTHIAALPGNPYDGHTLATIIPAMESMIGNTVERLLADAGYRGHNAPADTSSGSTRQARSGGSHRRSSASCGAVLPSSQ
jgi:transposase, IS5 family